MNINNNKVSKFRRDLVKSGFMRNSSAVYNYTGREKLKELITCDDIYLYIKPIPQGFLHLAVFTNEVIHNGEIYLEIGTAYTVSRDDIIYGEKPYWKNISTDRGDASFWQTYSDSKGFENISGIKGYVLKRFPGQNKIKAKVRAWLRMVKHFLTGSF